MVSADGRALIYAHDLGLSSIVLPETFDPAVDVLVESQVPGSDSGAQADLIGALRSDAWVVYRSNGALRAHRPSATPGDPDGEANVQIADGALRAVALGDDHVVVREIKSAKRHVLYVVPVRDDDPSPRAIKLASGNFTRVMLTRGAPDAKGRYHDEYVVATAGRGANATTAVFDVESGDMVDSFPGDVATSPLPLQDIPGLDAVSPDANHLAYVTPAGSVALRDLQGGGSCVVLPHTAGQAGLAGFGRDGTLYFEFEEGRARGRTVQRVFAYDAAERTTFALSDANTDRNLRAVPAERALGPDGSRVPWAVGATGILMTLQPGADATALPASADEVSFLPRVDPSGGVWLLHASTPQQQGRSNSDVNLQLRRLTPQLEASGQLAFDLDGNMPLLPNGQPFSTTVASNDDVCVASPRPGSWSTTCAAANDRSAYLANLNLPATERADDPRDPQ